MFRTEKQSSKTLERDEWHVMTSCRLLQGVTAVVVSTAVALYWCVDISEGRLTTSSESK